MTTRRFPVHPALLAASYASVLMLSVLALGSGEASAQPVPSVVFAPDTVGPSSTTRMTFGIDNSASTQPVSEIAFENALPAGLSFGDPTMLVTDCDADVSAPAGSDTLTVSNGRLGLGASCSIAINVLSADAAGSYTNVSGEITSSVGSSGTVVDDLTVAVDRPSVSMTFNPPVVPVGGSSRLVFAMDNSANGADATFMAMGQSFPDGIRIADPANADTDCRGAIFPPTITAEAGADRMNALWLDVAAGSVCTLWVDVEAEYAGDFDHLSEPFTAGQFSDTVLGLASARLTAEIGFLRAVFVGDPVAPGGQVELEFTLINFDRSSAATNIAFTDDLDAALSGLQAVAPLPQDPCGAGSTLSGTGQLAFSGGSLAPGEACTFSVSVSVPLSAAAGRYINVVTPVTANVGGEVVSAVHVPDSLNVATAVNVTMTFTDDPVGTPGTATVEFVVTNTSPTAEASDIGFQIPFGQAIPGSTANLLDPSTCATFNMTATPGPVDLTVGIDSGYLEPAETCTLFVVLSLPGGLASGEYFTNTGPIVATVLGETVTASASSDTLIVVGGPRFHAEFIDDPVDPGATVTLEYALSHEGEGLTDPAEAIAFVHDLGDLMPGLEAVGLPASDVCGAGSQLSGATTLTLDAGLLDPSESCTFSVVVQVPSDAQIGPHGTTLSAPTATISGVDTAGNAVNVNLEIAGLTVTKSFVDDPVLPGGTVTLEYTIDNMSPVDITNIMFADEMDLVVPGLDAVGLPMADPCGTGSNLVETGDDIINFSGGQVMAGATCTFAVTLEVPADAAPDRYPSVATNLGAFVDGMFLIFTPPADVLEVIDPISLAASFIESPARVGETTTLEFTITNAHPSEALTNVALTADIDAALAGLTPQSLPLNDVCGAGSVLDGSGVLALTGASLAGGETCTFAVVINIPADAPLPQVVLDTSDVSAEMSGTAVTGPAARAELALQFALLTSRFEHPAGIGATTTLEFTIENLSTVMALSELRFIDDLGAALPGLVVLDLPSVNPCGPSSVLSGTSTVALGGGSLDAGASCTFSVEVQTPMDAEPGETMIVTSPLSAAGQWAAGPASATLIIMPRPLFSKAFDPDVISLGDASTVTWTVDNTGSTSGAFGVSFMDVLPAALAVADPANASSTCDEGTLTAEAGSGVIEYIDGRVPGSTSCTVSADVVGLQEGVVESVSEEMTSSLGSSGSATATITVEGLPVLALGVLPEQINVGDDTVLTFTLSYSGSSTVETASFDLDLPDGLAVATAPELVSTCADSDVTAVPGGASIEAATGDISPSCTIELRVSASAEGEYTLTTSRFASNLGSSDAASVGLSVGPMDLDTDDDGVEDADDSDPDDPNVCRDVDADTCDDCAVTGADGSGGDPSNDGLDTDEDGTCDAGEPGNNGTNNPVNNGTNNPVNNGTNNPVNNGTNNPVNNGTNNPANNGTNNGTAATNGGGSSSGGCGCAVPSKPANRSMGALAVIGLLGLLVLRRR